MTTTEKKKLNIPLSSFLFYSTFYFPMAAWAINACLVDGTRKNDRNSVNKIKILFPNAEAAP